MVIPVTEPPAMIRLTLIPADPPIPGAAVPTGVRMGLQVFFGVPKVTVQSAPVERLIGVSVTSIELSLNPAVSVAADAAVPAVMLVRFDPRNSDDGPVMLPLVIGTDGSVPCQNVQA